MGYAVPIVADVTTMEQRPPVHPEQVAALESRGFRELGRFATLTRPSGDDRAYAGPQRARLDDWRQRPAATVLVAPDGSAFAGVDVFGEARMLRLRTGSTTAASWRPSASSGREPCGRGGARTRSPRSR